MTPTPTSATRARPRSVNTAPDRRRPAQPRQRREGVDVGGPRRPARPEASPSRQVTSRVGQQQRERQHEQRHDRLLERLLRQVGRQPCTGPGSVQRRAASDSRRHQPQPVQRRVGDQRRSAPGSPGSARRRRRSSSSVHQRRQTRRRARAAPADSPGRSARAPAGTARRSSPRAARCDAMSSLTNPTPKIPTKPAAMNGRAATGPPGRRPPKRERRYGEGSPELPQHGCEDGAYQGWEAAPPNLHRAGAPPTTQEQPKSTAAPQRPQQSPSPEPATKPKHP